MIAQKLNLNGKRYVVLAEEEYDQLLYTKRQRLKLLRRLRRQLDDHQNSMAALPRGPMN